MDPRASAAFRSSASVSWADSIWLTRRAVPSSRMSGFRARSSRFEAFGDALHLRMARVDGEDVGALLVIRIGDRAWELFGGWSGAHSEKRPFYLLKWHSLMQMKELGVRRYDMWGLAEGDELSGVETFKLGFGGEVTPWIGALETPVTAFLFPLWRFGARRRLAAASASAMQTQRPLPAQEAGRDGVTPRSARPAVTPCVRRPGR